jgi:hypothetical protein
MHESDIVLIAVLFVYHEAKAEAKPTSMRRPKLMPWATSRAEAVLVGVHTPTSTHTPKMMPSRGLQAIRGNAPRLYQQQCRNVLFIPSRALFCQHH